MVDLASRSEPQLMLDTLMHALRVRDEPLNAIASEVLVRCGCVAVRRLVLASLNKKNRPDHRIRALAVIAKIRPPYGPDVMDLAVLSVERNKIVREAARDLLGNYALAVGVPAIIGEPPIGVR